MYLLAGKRGATVRKTDKDIEDRSVNEMRWSRSSGDKDDSGAESLDREQQALYSKQFSRYYLCGQHLRAQMLVSQARDGDTSP